MFSKFITIFVFSLILTSSVDALKILSQNGTIISFDTPAFIGNKNNITNGQIISYLGFLGFTQKEMQSCKEANPNSFLNGSIAIVAPFGGCSIERHIEVAQNAGAVAVIVILDQIWRLCNMIDVSSNKFNNKIPAICISSGDMEKLTRIIFTNGSQKPPQPTIAMFEANPNTYLTLNHHGMNFVTIFFFINFVAVGVLALAKLIYFWKVEGFMLTTSKFLIGLVLYMGIVDSLVTIDLLGWRLWYANVQQFDTTYTILFASAPLYGFLIFGADVANVLAKISVKKKTFQIIIYSILSIYLIFYTTVNIVDAVYGYTWNLTEKIGNTIIWVVFSIILSCGLFYSFAAFFLIKKLFSVSKNRFQGKSKYRTLTVCIIICFFATFIGAITFAISTRKDVRNNPKPYLGVTIVLLIVQLMFCYAVLISYRPNFKKAPSFSSHRSKDSNKFVNLDSSHDVKSTDTKYL